MFSHKLKSTKKWFKRWFRRYDITRNGNLYLRRWIVFPWSNYPNIYIHKIVSSDPDLDLHDHPWDFVSLVLKGYYFEYFDDGSKYHNYRLRSAGSVAYRKAEHTHRVVISSIQPPVWTICLVGRRRRVWGFINNDTGSWLNWRTYVESKGEKFTESH